MEKRNKILSLFVLAGIVTMVAAGCSGGSTETSELREIVVDNEAGLSSEDDYGDAENIAAIYRDIFDEAIETNTLGSLDTLRRIIARLGENGYVAVDSKNQVDMAGAEQTVEFCKAVDEKKNAKLTIIVIKDLGFWKFDLETENGNVNIVRGYYQYDKDGCFQSKSTVSYPADTWQFTEEGYLLFEGSYFSDENLGVGAVYQIPEEIYVGNEKGYDLPIDARQRKAAEDGRKIKSARCTHIYCRFRNSFRI